MFSYGRLQTSTHLSPETSIQLYNPLNNSQNCRANAIVDTGAVMTCIPKSEIKKLGNSLIYNKILVRDANDNIQERKTYWINIVLAKEEYKNLEVIATSKKYALIGRDILNKHKVILDAPEERWGLGCNKNICPIMTKND